MTKKPTKIIKLIFKFKFMVHLLILIRLTLKIINRRDWTMLSELGPFNKVEKIINEILINRHFTPAVIIIIKDFFRNMNNIVYNKEEFLRDILIDFNNYRVEENKIRDYLNLAIKAIRLTEKNFTLLEKEMLKEEGLKIKKIKVLLDNETVILKFTNNSKVLFSKESILKKYSLFNDTINYLNEKITKRNKLQLRKIVDCGKYGFLEASEFINEKRLFKYYFKSGELLAVLYLLC